MAECFASERKLIMMEGISAGKEKLCLVAEGSAGERKLAHEGRTYYMTFNDYLKIKAFPSRYNYGWV